MGNKGKYFWLGFLGLISVVFGITTFFTHEIWHFIFSLFYGVVPRIEIDRVYLCEANARLPVMFAGMYAEIIILFFLFILSLKKGLYKTAAYIFGNEVYLYPIAIFTRTSTGEGITDVVGAYMIGDFSVVYITFLIWKILLFLFLTIQIMAIFSKNQSKFVKKGDALLTNT